MPILEFPLDAPLAEVFQSGELRLGFADPIESAAVGTYYLAKHFQIEEGVYNLKIHATGQAIMRIGLTEAEMQAVATFSGGEVGYTQVYLPIGPQRVDFALTHADAGQPAAITFSLYSGNRLVYASAADGWVFDTAGYPSDEAVPSSGDPRLALPVLTLLPNWGRGITERIAFLTDVLESESGQAQTRALRKWPRREFEMEFMRTDARRSRIDIFIAGVGRRPFLLPLYHEQFRPVGGLAAGSLTLAFPVGTLVNREFMTGDLALVIGTDPLVYEILTVNSVDHDADTVTWASGPVGEWPDGTRVIPLRRARIVEQLSMSHPVNRAGVATIRAALMDNATPFVEVWNDARFDFPANWAGDVQFDYDRVAFTVDNQTGTPYIEDPGGSAFIGSRFRVLLRGREDVARFRRFIAGARGRARRFYMPTMTEDLRLAANIDSGDTSFRAEPIGYREYADRIQEAREQVEFVFEDDSDPVRVKVLAVDTVGSLEEFTVDLPMPPIEIAKVKRVQFLVPSRFDQDAFEFMHYVDEARAVETQVVTRSVREPVPLEGTYFYLTTPVYPLEAVEELSAGVSIDAGVMIGYPEVIEEMTAGVSVDVGAFRYPIITTDMGLDEIENDVSVDEGTLRKILLIYDMGLDEIENDVSVDGGTLVRKLVETTMDTDHVSTGVSIDGGSIYVYG